MKDLITWVIANYGTLSVISVLIFSSLFKGWGYIKNAILSIVVGHKFRVVFGDNPAKSIKEVHQAIQMSHDTIEVRLRISEKFLKIGIYICDIDGKFVWTNDYINEMFGLDSQEMIGFGWLQAIDRKDRKRVHEEWMYAIKEGIEYNSSYCILNERDGRIIDVHTSAIAVFNDKDEKQCYVGYIKINRIREPIKDEKT